MNRDTTNGKLKEYFSYEGRLNRKPYFLRYLGVIILSFIVGMIWGIALNVSDLLTILFTLPIIVFWLAGVVFMLFQSIKRLHDLNKSGWYLLIRLASFIPFIGFFIVLAFDLYLFLVKGTEGPNQFGPDPLNPNGDGYIYDTEVYERAENVYDAEVYESDEAVYDAEIHENGESFYDEEKREN